MMKIKYVSGRRDKNSRLKLCVSFTVAEVKIDLHSSDMSTSKLRKKDYIN